jgi:hypothetical protein
VSADRAGDIGFNQLYGLWQDGVRRLGEVDPADRQAVERVIDEIVHELNRRLGGPFTTDELAALYLGDGLDWCFDLATRVAPRTPAAWDLTTVAGAAFAQYARRATDFGGGRRHVDERQ